MFTPFPDGRPPDFRKRLIATITPEENVSLVNLRFGKQYEFVYDPSDFSVTYTKLLRDNSKLTPVTSGYDSFLTRRLESNLNLLNYETTRGSLAKAQRNKAGGLFQISIPIPSRAFESIFGEGGASLRVSGYRKISFMGRSTWTDKPKTAFNRQSKFPTLQMEQIYRFDIEGTIGSKISVKVSQDSRNDIPLANRLILRYRGNDDDILQTIEAGNTTLNLPSTKFLAYSTRVQGLFGIKATAKLADLSVTAIVSQEKGTTESIEISAGGSASATNIIKDIGYRKNTIFDLGRKPLIRAFSDKLPEPDKYDFAPRDSITKIIVYLDDNTNDDAERYSRQFGICYIDPQDTASDDISGVEYRKEGYFEVMEDIDYFMHPTEHYIHFMRRALNSRDLMAVYLEIYRVATGQVDTIGSISDTLRLKLIKPVSITKANHHVWEYEWKNVYFLGGTNLELNELDINIFRGTPVGRAVDPDDLENQDGIPYLQILGLDGGDNFGNGAPDGELDRVVHVDEILGLLFFPTRHPFNSRFALDTVGDSLVYISSGEIPEQYVALQDSIPEIYVNPQTSIQQQSSGYYLAVATKGRGQSEIALNATNIIEGSEVVTWNGQRLTRGKDYRIDTDFGRLTLLDEKYTDINSNLSIMFEKAPFFSLAKKSLFGTRLEYAPSNDFRAGATVLYKSDKSTNRKPRVGEETSKTLVWDADLRYRFENQVFTKLLNALPFYSSESPSKMQISAELAQSRPNPNVDGQVYIDDFEGSRDNFSLSIFRGAWRNASTPAFIDDSLNVRGKIAWHNPIEQISINEIYPQRDIGTGEQAGTNILEIQYKPVDYYIRQNAGDTTAIDTLAVEPEVTWNGFMRNIPEGAVLQLAHAQLLEMRINGDVGIMHIDLGRITEDINGDGIMTTEDRDGFKVLDEGEDVGIDGIPDSLELGYDPDNGITDPAEDNFNIDDIWRINGTEGDGTEPNVDPDGGYIPDTEDVDNDGFEKVNGYFSYRIDLSDTTQFEVIGTRNEYNWRTIRIPLRDPAAIDTIIGEPVWEQIQFARIWFDSAPAQNLENPYVVRVADIDLVSTTWGDSLFIADSIRSGPVSFDVAVINDEVDERYTSPPGVEGFFDQTRDVVEAEQSLLLSYSNLNARVMVHSPDSGFVLAADTGLAVRKFFRASNFMGYGHLKAFVHGGDQTDEDSVMFFFRVGNEKDSYYEYRTVLNPGWHNDNHVDIDFDRITGLKAKIIDDYKNGLDSSLARTDETGKYYVKVRRSLREPSLTNIQYFAMGVVNLDTTEAATGEVWIDELRLTDVRDDVGMAASISLSGNLSDLMTYNFNYSNRDAYYRGVSSATKGGAANNLGSGTTRKNYAFSGSLRIEKFFPRSLELKLPINFNWSQAVQEPLLRSGTDITVPDELKKIETAVTINKGFTVSQSFNKKTKNILFAAFLNRLKTKFRYNVSNGHSANQPHFFRENYSANASFSLSVKKVPKIQPLFWMKSFKVPFGISGTNLYLYPTQFELNGSMSSKFSQSLNQTGANPTTIRRDFKGSMRMGFKVFDNLAGNYNFSTNRDLIDPKTINITLNPKEFKLGVEQSYRQDFKVNYQPKIFSFLTHKIDYSTNYADTYRSSQNTGPYHSVSNKLNINLNLSLKHGALFGTNKRSRGIRRTADEGGGSVFSIFGKALTGIRYITDAIKPVSFRFGAGRSLAYPSLSQKANLKFRFGLSESPGVDHISINTGTVRQSKSLNRSISANSGVSLFSGISADLKYGRDERETFLSSPTISINQIWPNINFNFRSVKGLWIIGKLLNKISPSCKYSRVKSTKQRTNEPHPHNENIKESFSPLFSFSFVMFKAMRSSIRIEKSTTTTKKINGVLGNVTDITKRGQQSISFKTSYSFKSPRGIKLPIFGRIKFQSQMSLSIDVSYKKNKSESARKTGGYKFNITEDKTNLAISPQASYSFSTTVKGGLRARWQDSSDSITRTKRHTRELGFWVEMRF
ncbi:MAG: cell surface protein SprA [candidate division Zixibacteria bacterium]